MKSSPYLVARSAQHVRADRVHEGDAEGLDAGRAPALLARRHLVDDAVVEAARRRADGGRLRRGRRQRVELPAGAEAGLADLALDRQEAAGERRVRPVGRERDARAVADRRERELAGADQLDADLGAQRPARAGERLGDVGVEAARMRRVLRPGEHRHGGAVDLHRRAAHAARVAEGDEHHRRVAVQARAGCCASGTSVAPSFQAATRRAFST